MVKVWIFREDKVTDIKGKVRISRTFLCECGTFRVRRGMREHLKKIHGLNEEEIKRVLKLAEPKVW